VCVHVHVHVHVHLPANVFELPRSLTLQTCEQNSEGKNYLLFLF